MRRSLLLPFGFCCIALHAFAPGACAELNEFTIYMEKPIRLYVEDALFAQKHGQGSVQLVGNYGEPNRTYWDALDFATKPAQAGGLNFTHPLPGLPSFLAPLDFFLQAFRPGYRQSASREFDAVRSILFAGIIAAGSHPQGRVQFDYPTSAELAARQNAAILEAIRAGFTPSEVAAFMREDFTGDLLRSILKEKASKKGRAVYSNAEIQAAREILFDLYGVNVAALLYLNDSAMASYFDYMHLRKYSQQAAFASKRLAQGQYCLSSGAEYVLDQMQESRSSFVDANAPSAAEQDRLMAALKGNIAAVLNGDGEIDWDKAQELAAKHKA